MTLALNATLQDARAWLRSRLGEGEHCPVCTQFAKVYDRRINAGMARALLVMYREAGRAWLDKRQVLRGIGAAARDEALLRYWGLLEEDPTRTGWWRVTPLGEQFTQGLTTVPMYASVYNGRCLKVHGPSVGIRECLGARFDYDELMRPAMAGVAAL